MACPYAGFYINLNLDRSLARRHGMEAQLASA